MAQQHEASYEARDDKPGTEYMENARSASGEIVDHETMVELASTYVPGSEAEKKLLRKLDFRIIPCVWALYTVGYLDRANIGNAKTGGLEEDFNLTSNQYSIVLLVFFISYVIFEVPSNMIIARVRPSLYLCGIAVVWGAIAASMAAVQDWKQLAGVRFALGVIEAGFAPRAAFYLSSWYRRYELASRYSLYYTAVALSGAVSGLLAGLITQHLDGARGIAGWRWLFIIEGCGSSFIGLIVWVFMADYPSNTRWLTPEERLLAAQRLAYDGLANTQGAHGRTGEMTALKMAVADWRTWLLALIYALITGAQTMQYFIPTLVGALGWTSWTGQYHTIPAYAFGICCTVGFCFVADHFKNKSYFISGFAAFGTIFFIATTASTNNIARYVCTIFAFGSIFGISPLILMWVPNIIAAPAEKRAVAIAIVNALGNTASIYGVFLWPADDAPRYTPGFAATTVWMGAISVLALVAGWLFTKYPIEAPDHDEVVAAEIEHQRAKGLKLPEKKASIET